MKYLERLAWLLLVLIVVGSTRAVMRQRAKDQAESQAKERREEGYQRVLKTYSQDLRPGMNRKAVEDYLHDKKIEFLREPIDDLARIASEEPPWNCGTYDVYVKFLFSHVDRNEPQEEIDDKDILKEIKVVYLADRCL